MNLKLKFLGNIILVAIADVTILLNILELHKKGLNIESLENIILLVLSLIMGISGIVGAKDNFKILLLKRQWYKQYDGYEDTLEELEEEDEEL